MAPRIMLEDCFVVFCFINEAQCHGKFTKKHLLKYEVVLDQTAAASQTVIQLFHNALSGNDHCILIMLSKLSLTIVSILFPMQ